MTRDKAFRDETLENARRQVERGTATASDNLCLDLHEENKAKGKLWVTLSKELATATARIAEFETALRMARRELCDGCRIVGLKLDKDGRHAEPWGRTCVVPKTILRALSGGKDTKEGK